MKKGYVILKSNKRFIVKLELNKLYLFFTIKNEPVHF